MDICQHVDCKRLSRYGHEKGKPLRCFEHKLVGMKEVKYRRKMCQSTGCEREATFGNIARKPLTCSAHKSPGMTNVKDKKCDHEGCSKIPKFAMPGQHAIRCVTHKDDGMIDVRSAKKCNSVYCDRSARHKDPVTNVQACNLHVRPGMLSIPKCNCSWPGCTKQRSFGVDPKKLTHCGSHKLPGMMSGKARCTAEGPETAQLGLDSPRKVC